MLDWPINFKNSKLSMVKNKKLMMKKKGEIFEKYDQCTYLSLAIIKKWDEINTSKLFPK